MAGRRDTAKAALSSVKYLSPDLHTAVLDSLGAHGLLDNESPRPPVNGGKLGELHAASDQPMKFSELRRVAALTWAQAATDPRNLPLLKTVLGSARRLGVAEFFEDDTKPLDVTALNRALRDKPVEDRFKFKSELYTLRLIPA
jgi:hypothetical protein